VANSSIITSGSIRQQFADTSLPADPTDSIDLPGSQHWPDSLREQLKGTLAPAGVLIPIFDRPGEQLSVLLTQRSAELKHHAGQISFPGGRMEPDDRDIAFTALRETEEEVGIHSEHVTVVGYLPPMPTISGYAVTPIVGLVAAAAVPQVDQTEVEFAFEVPLSFLLEPGNRRIVDRDLHGKTIPMTEFHYEQHRIWGATAMMIIEFIKVLENKQL
jgi:8-oxo-dGTP pyrophosphatase MutT (NUDIX family)